MLSYGWVSLKKIHWLVHPQSITATKWFARWFFFLINWGRERGEKKVFKNLGLRSVNVVSLLDPERNVCLSLDSSFGVEVENNLTIVTTLGLLFTRLSWSLQHFIVPRISCEGVKISSWSTKGQRWPSGLAAVGCFLAPLMLSGGCQIPLHVIIWGKCKSTQLPRAHQRKADRYCPFPKNAAESLLEFTKKRGLVPRHLEGCGTSWNRKKLALSHTISSPLF